MNWLQSVSMVFQHGNYIHSKKIASHSPDSRKNVWTCCSCDKILVQINVLCSKNTEIFQFIISEFRKKAWKFRSNSPISYNLWHFTTTLNIKPFRKTLLSQELENICWNLNWLNGKFHKLFAKKIVALYTDYHSTNALIYVHCRTW